MLTLLPLMLIPLIAYNAVVIGAGMSLDMQVMEFSMLSGAQWTMDLGEILIVVALLFLFVEVLKATRTGNHSVIDHLLSMLVFIGFLVEFLLVPVAATDIFFVLMVIAFIDVIAGFSISIRAAGRDVSIGL